MTKFLSEAEMPSNIALIKYMGKVSGVDKNRPTNSSISFTLPKLRSRVEISESLDKYDSWQTINSGEWIPTSLSDRGRKRFLAHFGFLKQRLGITGHYEIRSANNFPSDCGIASSASSFAALTMAAFKLAKKLELAQDLSLNKLADLSRVGSGSSIRSFLSPFVLWNSEGISVVENPFPGLLHNVIIVEKGKKPIGSSDAHTRVDSSLLFHGRPERAEIRLSELLDAFEKQDWTRCYEIVWAEFWDMHALFETSKPPFGYMNAGSLRVLNILSSYWESQKDGPIVTMDAGPNVHLLFREDQKEKASSLFDQINHELSSLGLECEIR